MSSDTLPTTPRVFPSGSMLRALKNFLRSRTGWAIAVLVLAGLWQLSTLLLPAYVVPSLATVFDTLVRLFGESSTYSAVFATLKRIFGGFLVSAVLGIGVGVVLHGDRKPPAALRRKDLDGHRPLGAGDDGLDDGSSLVVQQVHLVNDEQAHRRRHRHVPTLARDDVPLLGRGHNHLGLRHLLLAQLHVPRQLLHHQACSVLQHQWQTV